MKKTILAILIAAIASVGVISCSDNTKLEAAIKIANRDMPKDLGNGMTCEKIVVEENYVTYIYTVDEDLYDIDQMRENNNVIKEAILVDLKRNTNSELHEFFSLCKNSGKGIAYRYVGNTTGDNHTAYIEPYEF